MNKSASGVLIAEILGLAAFPALAFWLMHFPPVAQNGFIDPYVYTGYIHNFDDLMQRYGTTYYAVRFGLIAPAQLMSALFGPVTGYVTLRYALALIAGIPFYALVKERFGVPTAVAMFGLLLTSPYFARTVLWDHPDASAVPFLLAAICLLLLERRRHWGLDLCSGLCAGMAIHSNVFVAAPLAVFLAVYAALWLWWQKGLSALFRRALVILTGVVVITALASAYSWSRFQLTDIYSVTISKSLELARGGMAEYRTPGFRWVTSQWHVLTPVVLVALALLTWARRSVSFQDAAMFTGSLGVTAFFYVAQFLLNGNSLELFYYFSYLLPSVFLLLTLIAGSLWTGTNAQTGWRGPMALLAAAVVPWVLHAPGVWTTYPRFEHHLVILVATIAIVVLWRSIAPLRMVTSLCAMAALGLLFFSSFATMHYVNVMQAVHRPAPYELDVYRVAVQLIGTVPKMADKPGVIGFWYRNDPNSAIRSVQSTYLWGYSKVQGDGPGMPFLEAGEINRMDRMDLKWLVLLADNQGELAQGRDALERADVDYRIAGSRTLSSDSYTLHVELLEVRQ